jgi:hypothetical protein
VCAFSALLERERERERERVREREKRCLFLSLFLLPRNTTVGASPPLRAMGNDDCTENTNILFQKEKADKNRF